MANIAWDAGKYAKSFSYVAGYGEALLGLLEARPGMTCLDLGCGNGALTQKLKDAGLDAFGIDGSESQIKAAKASHPELRFAVGDATSFKLEAPVDVIFSNAVFHWIDKRLQPRMLGCVFDALKNVGQFVFEMGGKGNNAMIHGALARAYAKRSLSYAMPFYFPSIGEYAPLLEQAGFKIEAAWLFDRWTPLSGDDGLSDWIRMFVKKPFEGVAGDVKDEIIAEAVEDLRPSLLDRGIWHADYVRLRCKAVKPKA